MHHSGKKRELEDLIKSYYQKYYLGELGLSDYQIRIEQRLNEEEAFARPNIERIEKILRLKFSKQRVLCLGGGTGAELISFSGLGCDTYAIEPNEDAIKIIKMKCEINNIDKEKVYQGVAENLPFKDEFFDFIYCFTVIEHVQDVEQAIKEAVRVTKKNGSIYIVTPDYRQLYEGHYKMHMPLFLPKWLLKIILLIKGKPTGFLDTLQFVTAKKLRNIFRRCNVITLQIRFPYKKTDGKSIWSKLIIWMQDKLGIELNQFWILIKNQEN